MQYIESKNRVNELSPLVETGEKYRLRPLGQYRIDEFGQRSTETEIEDQVALIDAMHVIEQLDKYEKRNHMSDRELLQTLERYIRAMAT